MTDRQKIREALFETFTGKELFEFVCGEIVGYGIHRVVFDYRPDPTCVIKYQNIPGFQNAKEWELWSGLFGNDAIREWLAPCVSISENGIWLVQKKTKPVADAGRFPKEVPRFMTDLKYANFGMYQGRVVSHDYANHLCINYAISRKMKKAVWF